MDFNENCFGLESSEESTKTIFFKYDFRLDIAINILVFILIYMMVNCIQLNSHKSQPSFGNLWINDGSLLSSMHLLDSKEGRLFQWVVGLLLGRRQYVCLYQAATVHWVWSDSPYEAGHWWCTLIPVWADHWARDSHQPSPVTSHNLKMRTQKSWMTRKYSNKKRKETSYSCLYKKIRKFYKALEVSRSLRS